MKRLLLGIVLINVSVIFCIGQNSFEFGIESEEDCVVWHSSSDNDGNVVLVGNIGTYSGSDVDAYILKVFVDGSNISKRFDRQDTVSIFNTVEILDNGQYFLIGTYSIVSNYYERDHLWILILDEDLNIVTEKSYLVREPYVGFITSSCTLITEDDEIVFTCGALEEDKNGKTLFSDFAFYKFTEQGDTLVSKYYSYIYNEIPLVLMQMPNSANMMLIEYSTHYNNHEELMFLDPDLNIVKINQVGNEDFQADEFSSDFWLTDTSILISARNSFDMGTYSDFYISVFLVDTSAVFHQELVLNKIDTTDYPAWKKSMAYANDSTIYIVGFQCHVDLWTTEPTVVELYLIDKNLNLLGYKELGGDINYSVCGIIATPDDGCLIYGDSHTNDSVAERDVHIWKVLRDEINLITSVGSLNPELLTSKAYPNPVRNELYIPFENAGTTGHFQLKIFDASGKKMTDRKIAGEGNALKISVSNLLSGTYLYIMTLPDGRVFNGKFIKH
jgi:hypothetical protein